MPARLSVRKLMKLLERTKKAYDDGKDTITIKPKDFLDILHHLRNIHWTLRDVQLTLLRVEHSMREEEMINATDECLAFIEDTMGEVQTLFEDISEVEED